METPSFDFVDDHNHNNEDDVGRNVDSHSGDDVDNNDDTAPRVLDFNDERTVAAPAQDPSSSPRLPPLPDTLVVTDHATARSILYSYDIVEEVRDVLEELDSEVTELVRNRSDRVIYLDQAINMLLSLERCLTYGIRTTTKADVDHAALLWSWFSKMNDVRSRSKIPFHIQKL